MKKSIISIFLSLVIAFCGACMAVSAIPAGDVNADGKAEAGDLTLMKKIMLGEQNVTAESYSDYDTNTDGYIDLLDMLRCERILAADPSKVADIGTKNLDAYSYEPKITEVMPAIYINTTDGSNDFATKYDQQSKLNAEIEYVDATVSVGNCEDEYLKSDLAAQVKVRGNYTLNYSKKPIRIKFSKKQNMLGLNEGQKFKSWVLLADWKDLSMTNNTTAFYLGNTVLASDGYYCTDYRNVEVYLNGQYWGMYLLVEQQEAKEGRANAAEVDDDYTGTDIGYFFEYDGYYTQENEMPDGSGDPTFEISYDGYTGGAGVNGYTISSDIYSETQLVFLRSYVQKCFKIAHQAIKKGNIYTFDKNNTRIVLTNDLSAKAAIARVIDLQSLVDVYILYELACDPDLGWSSFYISLDMSETGNKKLTFEAPWDFDSCFGIKRDWNCYSGLCAANDDNPWINLFANEKWFMDMVKEKWDQMKRMGVLDNVISNAKNQKTTYANYYNKNYQKWWERTYYGNDELIDAVNACKSQGEASDYFCTWFKSRCDSLDGIFSMKLSDDIPYNAQCYRYEAEKASFSGGITSNNIRSSVSSVYASGLKYVGNLDGHTGNCMTFNVKANGATDAYLCLGVSKRDFDALVNNWFSVTVNGQEVSCVDAPIPSVTGAESTWHAFVTVYLAPIHLNAGSNSVKITVKGEASNLDYMDIYSTTRLS